MATKHSGIQPPITLLAVGKLPRARFVRNAKVADPASQRNLITGTVADREVTDPNRTNLSLQSHDSALGTSRTGRYVVMIDETGYGLARWESVVSHSFISFVAYSPRLYPSSNANTAPSTRTISALWDPAPRKVSRSVHQQDTQISSVIVYIAIYLLL